MSPKIGFTCRWLSARGVPPEHGALLLGLLEGIHASGSLSDAARALRLSYRHAWGLVTEAARAFGMPVVEMQRGRGAELTHAGETLLRANARVTERLAPHFAALEAEIARELGRLEAQGEARLKVHASHDLALAELRALARGRIELEIHFQGSQDSLEALAARRCEVAGFHSSGVDGAQALPLARWLRPRSHCAVHFARREQGLMVRPRSRIRNIRDLARPEVRFINRQPGSGTRQLVDQLLQREQLAPERVAGYEDEEFTHLAVAATVAAGRADAGFGIRAAAARHELGFVPLVTETYYLACSQRVFEGAAFSRLLEILRSRRFRSHAARLPGYDVSESGTPVDVAGLLHREQPSARASAR